MPYHTNKKKTEKKTEKKMKKIKMPIPMGKPRTTLLKGQKQLMEEHKNHHTEAHMKEMTKLMKKGYCFQQAHDITMKLIGK